MESRYIDTFDLARKGGSCSSSGSNSSSSNSDNNSESSGNDKGKGACLSGELALPELKRFCHGLPAQSGKVRWQARGEYNAAGQAFLSVRAQTVAVLECQRCLSLFEQPLQVSNRLELVRNETALEGDDAPDAVERIVGSKRFDLWGLIEDELILVLPYVPRHEACPSQAGRAPREEAAEEAKRPSPFAVLGKLKKPPAP